MVYVRSLEMISYRKMSLVSRQRRRAVAADADKARRRLEPREQEGQSVYMQRCSGCHGPGQMPMRSLKVIGSQGFRSVVRQGVNSMPAFPQRRFRTTRSRRSSRI